MLRGRKASDGGRLSPMYEGDEAPEAPLFERYAAI